MRNQQLLFTFLIGLALLVPACVEHLFVVQIYPDGRYSYSHVTKGDSIDVFDSDFPHPAEDAVWNSTRVIESRESGSDLWSQTTQAFLTGPVRFVDDTLSPAPLRHPMNMERNQGWIATHYTFRKVFKGRGIYGKYPQLGSSVGHQPAMDSLRWLPEALTYIASKALEDMKKDTASGFGTDLLDRILTHLNNYFIHVQAQKLADELDRDRSILYARALKPFEPLPQGFLKRLIRTAQPYEEELKISLGLMDDSFRFNLLLPGLITSTNADTLSGDTLQWSFGFEEFMNDDYTIHAEAVVYSKDRIQATILVATVGLLIILFLIRKRRK